MSSCFLVFSPSWLENGILFDLEQADGKVFLEDLIEFVRYLFHSSSPLITLST